MDHVTTTATIVVPPGPAQRKTTFVRDGLGLEGRQLGRKEKVVHRRTTRHSLIGREL